MKKRMSVGIILILLGVWIFLNPGGTIGVDTLFGLYWPTLSIIPLGLFFHWLYFSVIGRGVGLLVPGGTLLTVGVVCQIAMLFDNWDLMWPGFMLAPAVGLLELYWFGGRHKGLLIPIVILTVLSMLFFFTLTLGTLFNKLSNSGPVVAAVLVIAGVLMLVGKKKS